MAATEPKQRIERNKKITQAMVVYASILKMSGGDKSSRKFAAGRDRA
ncbi:MAG: hypothetical protein ABSG19_03460 [Candidatus Aminicenantales bacterium]